MVTAIISPGTFGHGGAYGTQSWADPVNETIYILMIQWLGFQLGDDSPRSESVSFGGGRLT